MGCCGKQRKNFKTKLAEKKKFDIENTPDEKLTPKQLRIKKRAKKIKERNERLNKRENRIKEREERIKKKK